MFKQNFLLEFILHAHNTSEPEIRNSLREFAENIEIEPLNSDAKGEGRDFKINMKAEDPTVIFDICAQFGRIRSAKITEG